MKLIGVLLLLAGLALIVQTVLFLHAAPMEEPASPGKTPNPSLQEEEIRRLEMMITLRLYVAPVAGLLMAGFGGWLLVPVRNPRPG